MTTELRYCRNCHHQTRHDIEAQTSIGEKTLLGIGTLGMIPALESLNKDSDYWGTIATCQRCHKTRKIK